MPILTLAVFLGVQWWAAWYPGAEPGGGGYVAQRIFSARSERDGVLATLSFQVAHYALRPWPWIITGLATVILYPNGIGPNHDHEAAYVQSFVDLLPTPWRGFMMAGFAAAYMSTVATQLNWGASYLVNDVYRRFMNKDATQKHYVGVSRMATIVLFLLSTLVTWQLSSVEGAWKFLLAIGAGTGLVLILRWYWWRINAWSEISAMAASFVTSIALFAAHVKVGDTGSVDYAKAMLITTVVSTATWLTVTLLTKPEPDAVLERFYRQVRPGGPGWRRVAVRLGYGPEPIPGGALSWVNWIAGVGAVYCAVFSVGQFLTGSTIEGWITAGIAVAAFALIYRNLQADSQLVAFSEAEERAATGQRVDTAPVGS
jgi:Na+/proline symporter